MKMRCKNCGKVMDYYGPYVKFYFCCSECKLIYKTKNK